MSLLTKLTRGIKAPRGTVLHSLKPKTNPLKKLLKEQIESKQHVSFAEYMETALAHPQYGYYSKDVFGKQGDFTTSPEISQLFGEMIAAWCVSLYSAWDCPYKWNIVEIGPGRGSLAMNVCRTLRDLDLTKGVSFHLVELSKNLRKIQQTNFRDMFSSMGTPLTYEFDKGVDRYFRGEISLCWYEKLSEFYQHYLRNLTGPVIVICHELFDALPVHVFEYSLFNGWCERVVTSSSLDQFELVRTKGSTDNVQSVLIPNKRFSLTHSAELKDGDRIELSPSSWNYMSEICSIIKNTTGAALIIDYGEQHAFSNSIRGIKGHMKEDISVWLQHPGEYDISAYVNFELLKAAAAEHEGLTVTGPVPQGFFLESMGIVQRVQVLSEKAEVTKAKQLETEYERLVSPEHMGETYKCLLVSSQELGDVYPFAVYMTGKETTESS